MTIRRLTALCVLLALLLGLCVPATASELSWAQEMVGYAAAAELGITGEGVVVGIIDSGLSNAFTSHSRATVLEGTNYLVAEDHPDRHNVHNDSAHGTAVASIIADEHFGLAPDVTIVPLKALDSKGGTFETIANAIYDAVDLYHCDILNLSLGALVNDTIMANAVQYALDSGVIVIAAVGNRTSNAPSKGSDPYFYPAAQDGVIAVGAVNSSQTVTLKSSQNDRMFIAAPGYQVPILTTDGSHSTGKGTSYAAPYVTAAAALALSADPDTTAVDFADLLRLTAEDLGSEGYDVAYGHGLLNLNALMGILANKQLLMRYDAPAGLLSGIAYSSSAEPYDLAFLYYDANGRFLSVAFRKDLQGLTTFDDISPPDNCARIRCTAVNSQFCPILRAAYVEKTSP